MERISKVVWRKGQLKLNKPLSSNGKLDFGGRTFQNTSNSLELNISCQKAKPARCAIIGTSYPKIATNFQSLYITEIFALLLWNLSYWLLLPSFRFSQIFIIFRQVVLEICDSSFFKFRKSDCERPCFDPLNAHILMRLLFCWRSKMCACTW